MNRIITLLTDFGTADGYVGEMKGVLLSGAPAATLVDITHEIPPQDVERGRLTVARIWRCFPVGTIHLVVVDPGVGSERAGLCVESDGRFLVGPDNGVLSPALLIPTARAVELPLPVTASATFHGRDLFAPCAAALARGETIDSLGQPIASPIVRRTPEPIRRPTGELDGEIILVDRFGNCVTNLFGFGARSVSVGARQIPVRRTYADVPVGELVALVGSAGFVEIAVRDGSAAESLSLKRGMRVQLRTAEASR
jgi:S-adenosylmethionine hydrolase